MVIMFPQYISAVADVLEGDYLNFSCREINIYTVHTELHPYSHSICANGIVLSLKSIC